MAGVGIRTLVILQQAIVFYELRLAHAKFCHNSKVVHHSMCTLLSDGMLKKRQSSLFHLQKARGSNFSGSMIDH